MAKGKVAYSLGNDISTDIIYPGRFMATVLPAETPQFTFFDDPEFNQKLTQGQVPPGSFIVAGDNFGCGSSREHAPWALLDFGFRAVISDRFADIFRSNSLKNGLLPITVEKPFLEYLLGKPNQNVRIDIHQRKLIIEGYGECEFPLDPFSAYCITRGIDQLDFILDQEQDINTYEQQYGK